MADKEEEKEEKKEEGAEGEDGGEGDAKAKSRKKLIMIAAAAVVVLIAVGAGLFFSGILGGGEKAAEEEVEVESEVVDGSVEQTPEELNSVYYELEGFIVNLRKVGGQPSFLKMAVTLEVEGAENVVKVQSKLPVIRDTFQVYLRELRADDLQGSSGIFRLREGLLLRVNKVVYPIKITDILFREILVQ
jgi:flagellar protein FliL